MANNRYLGTCAWCGTPVRPGRGMLDKHNGKWIMFHTVRENHTPSCWDERRAAREYLVEVVGRNWKLVTRSQFVKLKEKLNHGEDE